MSAARKQAEEALAQANGCACVTDCDKTRSCFALIETALRALLAERAQGGPLRADDVEWVVNSLAELGVKIGGQFFFLYKGESLVYDDPADDEDGNGPLMWRHVFKREFGECCHPLNDSDPTRYGTVSPTDSDQWKPLPPPPALAEVGK